MTDQDYEVRLRVTRENYEQRLQSITMQVSKIYQQIQDDEVIATMKGDPASNEYTPFRLKEICEDNLAIEREETIEKLIGEIANLKILLERCEREFADSKSEIEKAEDIFGVKPLSKHLNLHEKVRSLNERIKEKVRQESRQFELKLNERDSLIQDKDDLALGLSRQLEDEKNTSQRLALENDSLAQKIRKNKEAFNAQVDELQQDHQEKLEELKHEIWRLKDALSKAERGSLDKQILVQKNKIEAEAQMEKEKAARKEKESALVEKSQRLKRKLVQAKQLISALKRDNEEKAKLIEALRARFEETLQTVEDDLQSVKSMWAKKCQDVESDCEKQLLHASEAHKTQLASLQKHYQRILDDSLLKFQSDSESSQRIEQRLSQHFSESIENNYIKKADHERITEELTLKFAQEKLSLDERKNSEMTRRIKELSLQYSEETAGLESKLRKAEEQLTDAQYARRESENKLEISQSKIENLAERNRQLAGEVDQFTQQRKKLMKEVDECREEAARHKSASQEASLKISRLETTVETLQKEAKDAATDRGEALASLNLRLRDQESQIFKLDEEAYKRLKEYKRAEDDCREAANELRGKTEKIKELEREVSQAHVSVQEARDAHKNEASAFKRQLQEQKDKLSLVETELKNAKKTLAKSEARNEEASKDLKQAQQKLRNSHGALSLAQQELNRLKHEHSRLLKSAGKKLVAQKRRLIKDVSGLRVDNKKLLSDAKGEMLLFQSGLDASVEQLAANLAAQLSMYKQSYEHQLQKRKQKVKKFSAQLNDTFSQSALQMSEMERLRETISELNQEVRAKDKEQSRMAKLIQNSASETAGLEREKRRLAEELDSHIQKIKELKNQHEDQQVGLKEEHLADIKTLKRQHKKELLLVKELLGEIQNLHKSSVDSTQSKLEELSRSTKAEYESVVLYYENKIDGVEKHLVGREQTIKQTNLAVLQANQELRALESKTNSLLGNMESDLKDLQLSIEADKEKNLKQKTAKNKEIQTWRKESKAMRAQIEEMKEFIEKLENDKEGLRRDIRVLRESVGNLRLEELKSRLSNHSVGELSNRGSSYKPDDSPDRLSMSNLKIV